MKTILQLTISLALFLNFSAANAVTKTWTGAVSTDWGTAGNWNTSGVPGSADVVVIPNVAVDPIITTGTWPIYSLTINAGAILTQTGGTLAVTQFGIIAGTYTQSAGTYLGEMALQVNSGGILNQSGTGIIHMAAAIGTIPTATILILANGSISQSAGTISTLDIRIDAGTPNGLYTQTGGLLEVYRNVINTGIFSATQGTINFKGDGNNNVDFTGTCQFFDLILDFDIDPNFAEAGSPNILIAGDYTNYHTSVHYFPAGCTWTFNGSGNQTLTSAVGGAAIFGNLVINKSGGTLTLLSNANVGTTITVTSGIFDMSTFTSNRTAAGGTLTVSAGATLKLAAASGGQTGSNFPLNFTTVNLASTSTIEYYGSNAITQTIFGTPAYGHLTLTNGTGSGTANKISTANVTANGNLTINSGALFTPAAANIIGGTGTLTGSGTTVVTRTAATPDFNSQYTITNKTITALTIEYNATLAQTINALNYFNLTVSGTRTTSSVTFANSGTIGISGVFSPVSTFTTGGRIVTGSTIDFNGSGAQNIPAFTFNNLTTSGSGSTKTASGALVTNGTLNIASNVTLDMVTYAISGTLSTISGTGTLKTQNTTATPIPTGKAWTGTVEYNNASGSQTVVSSTSYTNLTNSNTSGTNTAEAALIVNGTLALNTSSVLDMVAYALSGTLSTISGTGTVKTQNTTATPIPAGKTWTGTVEYNKLTGGQTVMGGTYTNLTNTNTSGTNTAAAAMSVNGTLTLNTSSLLNMVTFALSGTLSSVSGTGILKTQNISATPIPTGKTWTGTIEYNNATGTQTVVAGTYTNLTNTNTSNTNSAGGAISVSGTFTLNASSVIDMVSYILSGTLTTIGGTGALKTQNTSATPIPSGKTWTGTIEYNNASGSQTVVAGTYNNLTNSNTSGTNTTAAALSVSGTLTLNTSSALDLVTYALSGSITTITGTGTLKTQNTSATPIPSGKTWTGTIEYNNATGGQTIVAATYTNLTNSNTSGTNTTAAALSVSGTLSLNALSILDLVTYALTGSVASITGSGTLKTQNTSATPIPSGATWTATIEYNNLTGGQTIVAGTYANLTNSNTSATNTAAAALSVSGTLTLNASSVLDLVTHALTGSVSTITGTGTLKTQNTTATPIPAGKTWTGAIFYNSPSAQNIVDGNYGSLDGTGGDRTLSGSGTTGISGIFTAGAGTYTITGSTIDFNSSSAQTIPAFTFNKLTLSGGNTKSVGGSVSIRDALTLSDNTTLALGSNNVTLKSDSTYTASVAAVPGTAAITYGSGKFVVERYIKGRRKYRLISSPVTTSANATLTTGEEGLSIWGNWQNQGNNGSANVGTIITGGATADGFDQQTPNASLYTYNDSTRKYVGFTSANGKNTKYTPLKAGIAYYMFVYGDRTNSITTSNPKKTVLSETGILLTGDQTYNTTSPIPLSGVTNRYTLLGNPFASAIDWATVVKTNISNTYWGWDPNLNSTGGYVTVSTTGTVTLISPFTGTTGLNQYIQSGQGFFVKTTGALPVLTIREQDKIGTFNGIAFRTSEPNSIPLLAINLIYDNGLTRTLMDGALAAFDAAFSNQVGNEDASKLTKSGEGVAIKNGIELLSIDARQMPQHNDTLFLNTSSLTKSKYTLQIFAKKMEGSQVIPYLEDNYLNTTQPLSLNDTNKIVFTIIASDAASSDMNRFQIVFRQEGVLPSTFTTIKATNKEKNVQIDWDVATETGIQKYEVERSADSVSFIKIAEVTAKGNNSMESYQWLDVTPVKGDNYYRVRAIQANGLYFFSQVVLANTEAGKSEIKIFPNPIQNQQISLQFNEIEKGLYTLLMSNSKGEQILKQVIDHKGGSARQIIPLIKKLPGGVYYVQIVNNKLRYSMTIFIE